MGMDPSAVLSPGQIVAAHVPYRKNKEAWIVAEVRSRTADDKYIVADKYPDQNKKPKSYTIPPEKLCMFPARTYKYEPGQIVLALWYMEEEEAWSSMFYKAIVIEPPTTAHPRSVCVQFEGEEITRFVDVMKTVKPLSPAEWKKTFRAVKEKKPVARLEDNRLPVKKRRVL